MCETKSPHRPGTVFLGLALLVAGCARITGDSMPIAPLPEGRAKPLSGVANPAAENCIVKGGWHTVAKRPSGAEYGVCHFEDNRQCEEWAMLRGECPTGGHRITGYATEAARYCAITGGEYTAVAEPIGRDERGTCKLADGKTCDADAYFVGECG